MAKGARPKASRSAGTTHLALGLPLACLSGCLVFLSFPNFDLFPLQWFSLVPLALAVRDRGAKAAFLIGWLAGLVTNIGGFYWIADLLEEFGHMKPLPSYGLMVLLALYQGLTFALSSGISAFVAGRLGLAWTLSFPFVLTAVEYLVPFIFPWYFANGQRLFPAATQVVEITGVSGLTFLLVLVNCAIAAVVIARLDRKRFPFEVVVPAVLLFIADIAYGVVRIREIDREVANAPKLKVGLVEADVGIWEKEAKQADGSPLPLHDQVRMLYGNLLKHQYLSAELEKEKPDLIVWPESSYIPLREVYSRRTDMKWVAVTADGRVIAVEDGKLREFGDLGMKTTGLRGVAAAHEAFIIAVGPRGAAYVFDGQGWRREVTHVDRDLLAVAVGPGGDEALAVGDQGVAVRRKDGKWEPVESGTTADLKSCTYSRGRFIAKGDNVAVAFSGKSATLLPPETEVEGPGPAPHVKGAVFVAPVPMAEGYPLPHDVRHIHVATTPLPKGDVANVAKAVDADSKTPDRDRNAAIRGFSTPLLFGAITYDERPDGSKAFYNTALLVEPDGRVLGRYDKNYLLIFGEYLPFADTFPFLRKWLPEAGDFEAGKDVEVFHLGKARIGVMICYEDIIPSFTRRLAGLNPGLLVNITNDAWFGKTSEPALHLQLATFRAIENRLFLVRSTNTGISAIVDPVGRIVKQTSIYNPETLLGEVAVLSGDTIYRRYGDVFAWAWCGILVLLVGGAILRRRRA